MFSRNKTSAAPKDAPAPGLLYDGARDAVGHPTKGAPPTPKGHPTPKRKVAEAANKRPLVPTDRKAAAKDARTRQREARDRQYLALQTGDERYLPARDKGPTRRYIREFVDARWNFGEFFLPAALGIIILQFIFARQAAASLVIVALLYLAVLATVVDGFIMWRMLRKRLRAKFGEVPKGSAMYAAMRAFQIRRTRLPKPTTKKHGEYPT